MQKDGKRDRKRYNFDYSVMCFNKYTHNQNEKSSFVMKVSVNDISYSGIGISGKTELNTGDTLILSIASKDSEIMHFSATVKWCKFNEGEYSSGLEFKELTRDHIVLLNEIIKNS